MGPEGRNHTKRPPITIDPEARRDPAPGPRAPHAVHRDPGADVRPITGGSDEEDNPEKARAVFEQYFAMTWAEWQKGGRKELHCALHELHHMRRKYPEEYERFLTTHRMDPEPWRRLRRVMEKHWKRLSDQ